MLLQIRTKDDLVELLGAGISHAWRVAESRLDEITDVEIYNFNGSAKLVGAFNRENTKILDNGRVAVAFKDARIEQCEHKWVGQNPVKYVSDTESIPDGNNELKEYTSNDLPSSKANDDFQFFVDADINAVLDQLDDDLRVKIQGMLDNTGEVRELAEIQDDPVLADKIYLCVIKIMQQKDADDLGWNDVSDAVDEFEWYYDVITSIELKSIAIQCLLKITLRTLYENFFSDDFVNGIFGRLEDYWPEEEGEEEGSNSREFVKFCQEAIIKIAKESNECAACYCVAQSLMRFHTGEEVEIDGKWVDEINFDINVIRSLYNRSIEICSDDIQDKFWLRGSVNDAFSSLGGEWAVLKEELLSKIPGE